MTTPKPRSHTRGCTGPPDHEGGCGAISVGAPSITPAPGVPWPLENSPPPTDPETAAGKTDVVMLELVDLDFVTDMALQLTAGLKRPGRQPNGWQALDPRKWRDKCAGAALRHMTAARRGYGELDPETGAAHWAAVAVNAMMCWWFERKITGAQRADNEEKAQ